MHGTAREPIASSNATFSSSTLPPSPFPLVFEQAPEGSARFVLMALLIPALVALITPFWLIVSQLASDPAARAVVTARPFMALQLVLGFALLISMFGLPLAYLARGAGRRRRITIDGGLVHSQEKSLFGKRSWTEPVSAYMGVAHRVRSSLSGVRHELVLVHQKASRSLILRSSPKISQEDVETAARLFALAEIPSREAASLAPLHGFYRLAEPQPQLAAA
jgi:hypothetical protein